MAAALPGHALLRTSLVRHRGGGRLLWWSINPPALLLRFSVEEKAVFKHKTFLQSSCKSHHDAAITPNAKQRTDSKLQRALFIARIRSGFL